MLCFKFPGIQITIARYYIRFQYFLLLILQLQLFIYLTIYEIFFMDNTKGHLHLLFLQKKAVT